MQSKDIFLIQSKPIDISIRIGNWVCWQFLAFTTALFIFPMAYYSLLAKMDEGDARFLAFVTCIVFYFIIDAGLSKMLEWAFKVERPKKLATEKEKSASRYISLVTLLIVVKLMATMTSSLWAAPEISDNLTSNEDENKAFAALSQKDGDQKEAQQKAFDLYQNLLATQDKRVKAAIDNGDYWQKKSYRKEGFGWLLNKKNDDPSDKAYALSIQSEMDKADKAYQHLMTFAKDSAHTTLLVGLAKKLEREAQLYESRKARRTVYVWAADFLAVFLGLFFTYLKALREKAGCVVLKKKNAAAIFAAFGVALYDGFINWLERFLGVDLNGDGTIGGETSADLDNMADMKQDSETSADLDNMAEVKRHGETGTLLVAETGQFSETKQPKKIGFQFPETTVKQPFHAKQLPVSNKVKQPSKTTETVVVKKEDVRYMKQRLKQSFGRMYTQDDPTTPMKNFKEIKGRLERIGYTINEKNGKLEIIEPPSG
jgi:hypothetical protein